uniref:Uncharacterized protein n=1 Tax=Megaselia scalaris TaxID=36166 RepID=T1H194_MEGSC
MDSRVNPTTNFYNFEKHLLIS